MSRTDGKTLYFEGAGSVPRGDVENCRIRTAFTNDHGEQIYLELIGAPVYSKGKQDRHSFEKSALFIEACFYINKTFINTGGFTQHYKVELNAVMGLGEYSKTKILNFINEQLHCHFFQIMVLDELSGYSVFKDKSKYNFGDEFVFDKVRTSQARKIKSYFKDLEKSLTKKTYSNLSAWMDEEGVLNILLHYDKYNDRIKIPDVFQYDFDYKKPIIYKKKERR